MKLKAKGSFKPQTAFTCSIDKQYKQIKIECDTVKH